MANKQIKDYTNLPLADTDSLIKQSVTGVTGKTTIDDLKANLDGRYQGKGTVIWSDTPTTLIEMDLPNNRIYEFWVITHASMLNGSAQIFRCYKNDNYPTALVYRYVNDNNEWSDGQIMIVESSGDTTMMSDAPIVKIIDLGEPI